MMSRKLSGGLAGIAAGIAAPSADASEGAASYYFPGAFGSFLVAVPPQPGFSVASQTLIFGGNAQKSILNGRQTFGINAFAVYEYLAGLYTFVGTDPALEIAFRRFTNVSPSQRPAALFRTEAGARAWLADKAAARMAPPPKGPQTRRRKQ